MSKTDKAPNLEKSRRQTLASEEVLETYKEQIQLGFFDELRKGNYQINGFNNYLVKRWFQETKDEKVIRHNRFKFHIYYIITQLRDDYYEATEEYFAILKTFEEQEELSKDLAEIANNKSKEEIKPKAKKLDFK